MTFGEPDESGGEQAMTELLGRGRNFTAVACYNDSMAAGAMGVLNDNGVGCRAKYRSSVLMMYWSHAMCVPD